MPALMAKSTKATILPLTLALGSALLVLISGWGAKHTKTSQSRNLDRTRHGAAECQKDRRGGERVPKKKAGRPWPFKVMSNPPDGLRAC